MCSDEHDRRLALVKMGLRLKAAFHGVYAQSSEMRRFVFPKGRRDLSQRDDRTQPGVLTPGNMSTQYPALTRRFVLVVVLVRIRPRGVTECWSNGVLRQVRIAPRVSGVGDAEGAEVVCDRRSIWSTPAHPAHQFYRPFGAGRSIAWHQGLKPLAESCSPFGTKICVTPMPKTDDASQNPTSRPRTTTRTRTRTKSWGVINGQRQTANGQRPTAGRSCQRGCCKENCRAPESHAQLA